MVGFSPRDNFFRAVVQFLYLFRVFFVILESEKYGLKRPCFRLLH